MERESREVGLHYETGRFCADELPICEYCRHLTKMGGIDEYYTGWECKAFPEGIPSEITMGYWSHETCVEGDHGFVFESGIFEDNQGKYKKCWDGSIEEI